MPVKVGATQEFMMSKLGMSIAHEHFRDRHVKKQMLLDSLHASTVCHRKTRKSVPTKSHVNGVDARFLLDEIDDEDEGYSGPKVHPTERNVSFSYKTPASIASSVAEASYCGASLGGAASTSLAMPPLGTYNAKEAVNTLRLLRRANQVDFSKFWGWERAQREKGVAATAASSSASARGDRRKVGAQHRTTSASPPDAARCPKPDAAARRVDAVRNMRAVYGQGMAEGSMADSIMSLGTERGLLMAADDEGDDYTVTSVQFSAPGPAAKPSRAEAGSPSLLYRAGIGGAASSSSSSLLSPSPQPQQQPRYKTNKPVIADLVLTDEHFDAVSKYFSSPLELALSAAVKAGPVLSYDAPPQSFAQPRGKYNAVVRVSPKSAGSAPMYIYSPHDARPDSKNNIFSPTNAGADSLDELMQFMVAVEESI